MRGILSSFLALLLFFPHYLSAQDTLGDRVLARYQGKQIDLKLLSELQPIVVSWMGVGTTSEHVQTALEDVIFNQLLAKESVLTGVDKQPEVAADLERVLAKAYLKVHAPREQIQISEEDLKAYYQKNLERFKTQDFVEVSQIVVSGVEQANKIKDQLAQPGNFERLAKDSSLDKLSAMRGGNLGAVQPNQLLPELRQAALALKPGEVSAPVKTALGFHLLRLEKLPQPVYRPFEEVRQDLYTELQRELERQAVQNVRQELFAKYEVKVDLPAIEELLKQKTSENVNVVREQSGDRKRNPGEATELQLATETLDFGTIPQKKFSSTIMVANAGNHALTISRVGSTCPCIEASAPAQSLQPGASAQIEFSYDPAMYKEHGSSQRVIFIESNDSIEPRKILRVQAEVKAE